MTDVLGTGLSGLVGSRIIKLLSPSFSFTAISKETGFDITNAGQMETLIKESKAPWVFHFAAYTNVQAAEDEKDKGKESASWNVNVSATENIAKACREFGKKLLYISTDYVFDGTKQEYHEEDVPHPISWYGVTKYEGEKAILASGVPFIIIRISTPYRSFPVGKTDFVHKILERLQRNQTIQSPEDQWFSPTFIDDLAIAIKGVVEGRKEGIYHVGSQEGISPFEAATTICHSFGCDASLVKPTSYDAYYSGKAKAPRHAILKHDKIDALHLSLHTFTDGVKEVQRQEEEEI